MTETRRSDCTVPVRGNVRCSWSQR